MCTTSTMASAAAGNAACIKGSSTLALALVMIQVEDNYTASNDRQLLKQMFFIAEELQRLL